MRKSQLCLVHEFGFEFTHARSDKKASRTCSTYKLPTHPLYYIHRADVVRGGHLGTAEPQTALKTLLVPQVGTAGP